MANSCLEQNENFCVLHKVIYCRGDETIIRLAHDMTNREIEKAISENNYARVLTRFGDHYVVTLVDQSYYYAIGCAGYF